MQTLPAILSASLLAFGLGSASQAFTGSQETQDTLEKKPYVSPQAKQQAKLEEALMGTWQLTNYQTPDKLFEGADSLAGWLMFRDGYLSWTVYGSEEVPALFGPQAQANLESVLYRYRVSPTLELQMASLQGFSDLYETDGLVFDDGHNALDYELIVDARSLVLNNPGVETFNFRRMGPSSFPPRAIRALETQSDFDPLDEDR